MLLDTHTLLWYLTGDAQLPAAICERINRAKNVYVSAASIWEIAVKGKADKLRYNNEALTATVTREIIKACAAQGFRFLPISQDDAALAPYLRSNHKDPFDRILAAQALQHELAIVSCDSVFDRFSSNLHRIWYPLPQPKKRPSRSS
jgi:PIN domain nuclease of toxin-antitoxin system